MVQTRREQKKRATRQHISDTATRLFIARGFEQVTVEEIAVAADVAKMTVFNYFPRKEDLFFDRTGDARELLRAALENRGRRSPLAALRTRVHELVAEGHPVTRVNREVAASWKVVADSPVLRARAFDLLTELEESLARMLAESVDAPTGDPLARLLAATLLGTWRVAFGEALRRHRSAPVATVRGDFLALVDRGFAAASGAARASAY